MKEYIKPYLSVELININAVAASGEYNLGDDGVDWKPSWQQALDDN